MHLDEPGSSILLQINEPVMCSICSLVSRRVAVSLETLISDSSELLGIDGAIRFQECGHRVPNASAHPLAIANMLEAMAELDEEDTGEEKSEGEEL